MGLVEGGLSEPLGRLIERGSLDSGSIVQGTLLNNRRFPRSPLRYDTGLLSIALRAQRELRRELSDSLNG